VNSLFLTVALLIADPGTFVLGSEAASVLEPWTDQLRGLQVEDVRIDKDHVIVDLAGDCVVRITHGPSCEAAITLGGGHACVSGDACPARSTLERSLALPGPIKLPWRRVEGSSSASRVRDARMLAQRRLDARDATGARGHLVPVARDASIRPRDRLSVLATLGAIGAGRSAWQILEEPVWAMEDRDVITVLRTVLLAGPALAAPMADALLVSKNACEATGVASGLLAGRRFAEAAELGERIRTLDPKCFEAYRAEMTALAAVRDHERLGRVFEVARSRFAGDARLTPLREMAWYAADDVGSIVAALEARVAQGERDPGLFKQLLALVVREHLRAEKMKSWLARAEADPQDRVAAFFAGVLLHYEREFVRSNQLLERAAAELNSEPRLHIYLAMNAFNLGDRARAESEIEEAARLETQDPDVFYCQGEIYRDTDPSRAREALATYWFQTELNSDPRSSKQERVRGMMAALDRCIADGTKAPCPGPWEHTFASAKSTP